ncbi:MAG TPA: hypothetical protein VHO25_10625, partial [Polyangiaceae bacterium]|nr:hypothetical protein [Polyangiaceae bacterium]
MRRGEFFRRVGAALVAIAAGAVLLACGPQVVPPGYPPLVGPGEGLALVNLWDQSCPQTDKSSEQNVGSVCDFSESVIVIGRLANPSGGKEVNTERIQFQPGYHLIVLPVRTWKILR